MNSNRISAYIAILFKLNLARLGSAEYYFMMYAYIILWPDHRKGQPLGKTFYACICIGYHL